MPGLLEIVEKTDNGFARKTIKIDSNILNKIRSLFVGFLGDKYLVSKLDKIKNSTQEPYEIPSDLFSDFIDRLIERNKTRLSLGEPKLDGIQDYADAYSNVLNQYRTFINSCETIGLGNYLFLHAEKLKEFIELSKDMEQKERKMYEIRDLVAAKEDIAKNLKYFVDEARIKEFEDRYTTALSLRNIEEMKQILHEIQQLILQHWKDYVTGFDSFKPGDKFRFICHSTNTTNYNGEFHTRFVSTSLLTIYSP